MYQKLNESRKEGKYVDFTIYAEGKPFPFHRVVVDAESEYFKLLFCADMREKKEQSCEQKEVTALGVERALDFMYVEELVLDNATVAEVLKVCHLWQLSSAVKQCESFLMENLDVDNCVSSRHLASLYDLQQLADQCTNFILSHLEEMKTKLELDDLLMLFEACATKNICAEKLWNFFSDWEQLRTETGVESALCKCNLIKAFPVEKFQISKFHDVVWKGTHITNCESCKDHTGQNFVRAVNSQHIEVKNCLFVKHLAKIFAEARVGELVDNFIVLNHRSVLTTPDFLDVMQDDVLKYVRSIYDECSVQEFSAIVNWIRRAPGREKVFSTLFDDTVVKCDKLFLSSVRSLKTSFKVFQRSIWLLKSDNCLFLKQLAEKYQVTKVQNTIDLYISQYLSSVSKQPDFLKLPLSSITKYINPDLVGYKTLWDAIMIWIKHDLDARKLHFPTLLRSLPLEKFPFSFLKDNVVECGLFSEPDMYLMKSILVRAINAAKSNAQLMERAEETDIYVKKMTKEIATLREEKRRGWRR